MINQSERIEIAELMAKYGGGFVKALSECVFRADDDNLQKLQDAFPEYFEEYRKENW